LNDRSASGERVFIPGPGRGPGAGAREGGSNPAQVYMQEALTLFAPSTFATPNFTKIKNQKSKIKNQKSRTKNQEPRTKNQEPRTKNQEPRTSTEHRIKTSTGW